MKETVRGHCSVQKCGLTPETNTSPHTVCDMHSQRRQRTTSTDTHSQMDHLEHAHNTHYQVSEDDCCCILSIEEINACVSNVLLFVRYCGSICGQIASVFCSYLLDFVPVIGSENGQ